MMFSESTGNQATNRRFVPALKDGALRRPPVISVAFDSADLDRGAVEFDVAIGIYIDFADWLPGVDSNHDNGWPA
jgi:hypothetical protein